MPSTRIRLWIAVVATFGLALVGCGGGGGQSADQAAQAKGPIKIWYSNNEDEVKWGKAVVAAWNQAHPDEQVTAEEIPAGKSWIPSATGRPTSRSGPGRGPTSTSHPTASSTRCRGRPTR